ncbi:hypothetical protein ACJ41O_000970 [Fusarium nematophilum]
MSNPYSLDKKVSSHALAWDTLGSAEKGSSSQPWREFWPPRNLENVSSKELKEKPWLTWKRDPKRPNDKPWYDWVNVFEGEVDVPCQNSGGPDKGGYDCRYCDGRGCYICSTVAEGG